MHRERIRQPRLIGKHELKAALDYVAGEGGRRVPEAGVLEGLVQAGLVACEPVGVGGFGRRYTLTPRGTVERIARM